MTDRIPPEIWEAAKQRSLARAGEDYEAADALRAEIEAAGWRVVDSGTSFRLEPVPADVEVGGEIRYGSSEAVPSRLEEARTGLATVVLVASPDPVETLRSLEEALLEWPGVALITSHDRWFLDRLATHILAFEGDSNVVWFTGSYHDYEADRKKRLGAAADRPHRIKNRKLTKN